MQYALDIFSSAAALETVALIVADNNQANKIAAARMILKISINFTGAPWTKNKCTVRPFMDSIL